MKKILCLVLTLLLTLGLAGQAFATFTDVTDVASEIDQVVAAGLMQGYPDGTFRPNDYVTRAEFAKVAVLAWQQVNDETLAGAATTNSFSDVKADAWYTENIERAVALGLMQGYPDGTFRPGSDISAAEVLTVLLRIAPNVDLANLAGAWPDNYIQLADEIGFPKFAKYNAPCPRGTLAVDLVWLLEQGQTAVQPEALAAEYGVVTGVNGSRVTIYGAASGQKIYKAAQGVDVDGLAAGTMLRFFADKSGALLSFDRQGVMTNDQHDAVISREQIELNGKYFGLAKTAKVLLINKDGGINEVEAADLLGGTYAADLRAAKVTAPLQYVLEGNKVGLLLVGDYAGSNDMHFGFLESVGQSADGTVVSFWDNDATYEWDTKDAPKIDQLYAYRISSNGVRASKVDGVIEATRHKVTRVAEICQTEDSVQFIITDDTVIIEVKIVDGSVDRAEYVDDINEGDKIGICYDTRSSNGTGIEAACLIKFVS